MSDIQDDDVLSIEEDDPVEQDAEEGEAPDLDGEQHEESEEDGEPDFSFGEEGEAGEGEEANDTPVIRDFRRREREKDRELRLLRRENETLKSTQQPAIVDPGPEPNFETEGERYDWDADAWTKERVRPWMQQKAAYEQAQRDAEQHTQQIKQAYEGARSQFKYAGMREAEERVFAEVGPVLRDVLIYAKAPELVAALDSHPDQLQRLAGITNPVEAILAVGEMKGKLKVNSKSKRKPPAPDQPARGSGTIAPGAREAAEKRLEAEADKTGDRSKLIAWRSKNKQGA